MMPLAYDYQQENVQVSSYEKWFLTGGKAECRRRRAIKRKRLRKLLLLGAVAVLAAGLLFGYLSGLVKIVQLRASISGAQKEIAAIKVEIAKLEEEKALVESPEYVEKVAREKLGLVKPGEVKYVVTSAGDGSWQEKDVKRRAKKYDEPLY
ncbi:MAG: septum formation initiator family protein [Firmicutes bacterium]|nr:septum formation initiator family protein [Bacillota bacterium]